MNGTISITSVKKIIVNFLHRFHLTIFVVVVLGSVIIVVALLNDIIARSGSRGDYTPKTTSAAFDQATIKKIEELKTRDQNGGQLNLSGGRTNPFVE